MSDEIKTTQEEQKDKKENPTILPGPGEDEGEKVIVIPVPLFQAVLETLQERPFKEVSSVMNQLTQQSRMVTMVMRDGS